jgi:hypothetical protein
MVSFVSSRLSGNATAILHHPSVIQVRVYIIIVVRIKTMLMYFLAVSLFKKMPSLCSDGSTSIVVPKQLQHGATKWPAVQDASTWLVSSDPIDQLCMITAQSRGYSAKGTFFFFFFSFVVLFFLSGCLTTYFHV